MKKIIFILLFVFSFTCVNSVFSAQSAISTGAQFTITDGGSDGVDLTFGLSPKVVARYINPGDSDNTAQWYSIGTVHPGGTEAYGTTQDLNNMYKKDYETGTAISATILDIPDNKTSADSWEDGWEI